MKLQEIIKITPRSIVAYRQDMDRQLSENQLIVLSQNWSKVEYNGFLSKETKSKVMNMLNAWQEAIYTGTHELRDYEKTREIGLRFLTLTISKQTQLSDNEVKRKALMPFIEDLKVEFGVEHYFWRAEAQKNGRIHFHLLVDKFMDKHYVNWLWDKWQANSGITDEKKEWHQGYTSPSTRIEIVKGGENAIDYLLKYVSKDESVRKIEGRIWGCSDKLREITVPSVVVSVEIAKEVCNVINKIHPEEIRLEHAVIYNIDLLRCTIKEAAWFRQELHTYYTNVFRFLYIEGNEEDDRMLTNEI
jgi:hypothetical protein